ncbi:MAG: DNA polymerase III subunit alpha [Dehalococcoidia bacterium]
MFTHLHTHSEYSLLDGLCKITDLIDEARNLGSDSIALTDHGSLYGAVEFYRKSKAAGIKPIIGVEAYVAPNGRHSRLPGDNQPYHLVLLAKNKEGYHNLLKLVTLSHLEGFYYRPRIDRELLKQYSGGIIALSGCLAAEIPRAISEGRLEDAREAAIWHRDVFEDYYLEVQRHDSVEDLEAVNNELIKISSELSIPLVATNDLHYVHSDDDQAQDVLLCIQTNSTLEDTNRMKMDGGSYYLKSEEEMRELFKDIPQAVDNTAVIANKCELDLEFNRLRLPQIDIPENQTSFDYLESICREGFKKLYEPGNSSAVERLEYELRVIKEMEFSDYFLVVWDIAKYAREKDILIGVRGSAAASLILYCLNITDIDPLEYALVFERFLNLERIEMPDIDLDIEDTRRDEILDYVMARFGEDRVAQIITFGTLGPRAAIRDVGRVLGIPYSDVDEIARLLPNTGAKSLNEAVEENAELSEAYEKRPYVKELIDTAKKLEGVSRHASTHAAGVVISQEPLSNVVPLQRPTRTGSDNSMPMTQWDMNTVAEVGLLKMDFLGLSNLSILGRTCDLIKSTQGIEIDLKTIPLDDAKTFELLCSGETTGLFQLEGSGMRRWIKQLKPENIQEISAMIALYRPGPMEHIPRFIDAKFGRIPITYPHEDLAELLSETYGIIVYQDQVLKIAQKFAGYTLGQADIVRKAMGKKISSIMSEERDGFLAGASNQGYSHNEATAVFDLIEPFAGYAFNKAHSVSYAYIAYQTAFLKANYPTEYLTCLLNSSLGQQDRMGVIAEECKTLGIEVKPPSVSYSEHNFSIGFDKNQAFIMTGLTAVKNVGVNAVEKIIGEQKNKGPYTSLENFIERADLRSLNRRGLESLIKAGALDDLGERGTLEKSAEKILNLSIQESKRRDSNQTTMFDMMEGNTTLDMPSINLIENNVTEEEKGTWEKEMVGIYFTYNPFELLTNNLDENTINCGDIGESYKGKAVDMIGIVISKRTFPIRNGQTAMSVTIQDTTGSTEVTVWPDILKNTEDVWNINSPVAIHGKVRGQGERLTVSCESVATLDINANNDKRNNKLQETEKQNSSTPEQRPTDPKPIEDQPQNSFSENQNNDNSLPVKVTLELRETDNKDLDVNILTHLVGILREFPGNDLVHLNIIVADQRVDVIMPQKAQFNEEFKQAVENILGEGKMSIQRQLI